MAIMWKIQPDGAFICGDTESGVTSYSYPSSENADRAARAARRSVAHVEAVAEIALEEETTGGFRGSPAITSAYDRRNWRVLFGLSREYVTETIISGENWDRHCC